MERKFRIAAVAMIAAMLAIYYWNGLVFQYWPDSGGYLVQGMGLAGLMPFSRPVDRNVGYPALVALALLTPRPALALVVMQAALVATAFAAIYVALRRWVLPRLELATPQRSLAGAIVLTGLAAASLYSVIHVQIAALLTEILFASLALLAVLATVWLVLPERVSRRPWLETACVALVAGLPAVVKPHWQFAGPLLALIAGGWLWRRTSGTKSGAGASLVRLVAAIVLPLAIVLAAIAADRAIGARFSPREQALFGPRTAFCNHAHLVLATMTRRSNLQLQQGDAAFEAAFKAELQSQVASHNGGWTLLGFNGDLCTYSNALSALLDRRFPEPGEQAWFLVASLARAALADPLPYAMKVLRQMAAGFLTAFPRFAIHTPPGVEGYRQAEAVYKLPRDFTRGVQLVAEHGPLPSRQLLRGTWPGRLVHLSLAIVFFGFAGLLVTLVLLSVAVPVWRWQWWTAEVRNLYLAFVVLPLFALLAHHVLIALVHSFDIWRYGFNVYFVNLFFIGAAALFWLADWQRWRAA